MNSACEARFRPVNIMILTGKSEQPRLASFSGWTVEINEIVRRLPSTVTANMPSELDGLLAPLSESRILHAWNIRRSYCLLFGQAFHDPVLVNFE